jgi:hypothetical protein
MEAIYSSEVSVLTRTRRHHIQENGILHPLCFYLMARRELRAENAQHLETVRKQSVFSV